MYITLINGIPPTPNPRPPAELTEINRGNCNASGLDHNIHAFILNLIISSQGNTLHVYKTT